MTEYVEQMNAKLGKFMCEGPYSDCGTGMTCTESTQCKRMACDDSTIGIVTKACYGFCMAAQRQVVSAKMSDDGKLITVALSTAAAPGSFPCAAIFSVATMQKLGYDAACFVSSEVEKAKEMVISLGPQSTFMPGEHTLTTSVTQGVLVDILSPTSRFVGTDVPVAKCETCTGATAALFGPKVGL